MSILVLIESPGKLKKIQSFLGDDYTVMASMGHIRQLPKDDLGFDIANNYTPEFEIMPEKMDVVKKIRAKGRDADKIIMASDSDLEGAAISWHCAEILKLPADKRLRATFTEITKKAITTAIANTIEKRQLIDMNQVHAQFARMVLDKLIGYKISPLLWKEYGNYHLSCGRVQSPVVRLIAEREAEISQFNSEAYFKLDGVFVLAKKDLKESASGSGIQAICDEDIKDRTRIETLYSNVESVKWTVRSISKTQSKRNPSPPFITSTMQQEASARLGMSPDICMKVAQKLYEAGMITYMRTDALFIAEDAHKTLKAYIEKEFGESYYRRVNYKSKSASAQEAHECCRPVDINKKTAIGIDGLNSTHNRLYQLIWRRTVASQMAPADVETHTAKIESEDSKQSEGVNKFVFVSKYEKILFNGYLAAVNFNKPVKNKNKNKTSDHDANPEGDDPEGDDLEGDDLEGDDLDGNKNKDQVNEKLFAKLKEGTQVWPRSMNAIQKFTKPPHARYTEASLIKKLDDLGIGRPSTYANMIKKVQEEQRQYVEKRTLPAKTIKVALLDYSYPAKITITEKNHKIECDRNKLFPTSLGIMINEYLEKHFLDIINYDITAQIESLLDEIATGSKIWYKVVDSVYIKLNPIIDQLARAVSARKTAAIANPEADTANRKLLGIHPLTNIPVYALKSRKGFLICESNPDKTKSRFANFTGRFDSMTLEKAITLLVYPRTLGDYEDGEIILKKAKNIYLAYKGVNYSIESYNKINERNSDLICNPEITTLEDAIRIITYYQGLKTAKTTAAQNDRQLRDDVIVKVGPYGPYIKYQNQYNIPLPKKLKERWESITIEECEPVIEKGRGRAMAKGAKTNGKPAAKPAAKPIAKNNKKAKVVNLALAPITLDNILEGHDNLDPIQNPIQNETKEKEKKKKNIIVVKKPRKTKVVEETTFAE